MTEGAPPSDQYPKLKLAKDKTIAQPLSVHVVPMTVDQLCVHMCVHGNNKTMCVHVNNKLYIYHSFNCKIIYGTFYEILTFVVLYI